MRDILFICDYAYRLPQRLNWRQSFNLKNIFDQLREHDYFPILTHYEDENLIETIRDLGIKYCVTASSWKKGYRQLVENKLLALDDLGVKFVPTLKLMLSYENKSLQAELANVINLPMPESRSVSTFESFLKIKDTFGLPFVIKEVEGYASSGVQLVRNEEEEAAVAKRYFTGRGDYSQRIGLIVAQRYIPNLKGDWKVIVVDDTAAALFREVRANDFRASGSGLFKFLEPPPSLLDFAYEIKEQLGAPWVSLDIAQVEKGYMLLEFQATHFGTTTTDKAPFHFIHDQKGQWIKQDGPVDMETHMTKAIIKEIRE